MHSAIYRCAAAPSLQLVHPQPTVPSSWSAGSSFPPPFSTARLTFSPVIFVNDLMHERAPSKGKGKKTFQGGTKENCLSSLALAEILLESLLFFTHAIIINGNNQKGGSPFHWLFSRLPRFRIHWTRQSAFRATVVVISIITRTNPFFDFSLLVHYPA